MLVKKRKQRHSLGQYSDEEELAGDPLADWDALADKFE